MIRRVPRNSSYLVNMGVAVAEFAENLQLVHVPPDRANARPVRIAGILLTALASAQLHRSQAEAVRERTRHRQQVAFDGAHHDAVRSVCTVRAGTVARVQRFTFLSKEYAERAILVFA